MHFFIRYILINANVYFEYLIYNKFTFFFHFEEVLKICDSYVTIFRNILKLVILYILAYHSIPNLREEMNTWIVLE